MCGIVTMILKDQNKVLGKEYSEMFKQMLHADAVRGWDSTGIACIKAKEEVVIVKDAMVPSELFDFYPEQRWIYQNRAYIGHNRWATKGKTNAENAHPFNEGNITLVHNGTLRYHQSLKNVEVDSHAITHAISEKGAIETLEILDGAYALVWHDAATGNIHAARNDERPLLLLETQDLYLLSSERGLVYWICERFKVKVRKCAPIEPGVLLTFRKNKKDVTIIEQTKFTVREQETYMQQGMLEYYPPTKITPYEPDKSLEGIQVGQKIEVIPFHRIDLGYNAFSLGPIRWACESLEYPDLVFELYTENRNDLFNKEILVTVDKMYSSFNATPATVITKFDSIIEKKDDEPNDVIKSINGVPLTPEVIEMAKNTQCCFCSEPFVIDKDIALIPIMANGHTYKYTYYCPDCSEIVSRRKQIRALH